MGMGILFLVLTGLCWVVLGVVISNTARKGLDFRSIQGIAAFLMMICALPMIFLGGGIGNWKLLAISVGVAGFLNYFGMNLLKHAMVLGPNGLSWGIGQSALILPFLMGTIFFAVPCSLLRVAGMTAILSGIGVFSSMGNDGVGITRRWLKIIFSAFMVCGLTQCAANFPSYFGGGETTLAAQSFKMFVFEFGTFLACLSDSVWQRQKLQSQGAWKNIVVYSIGTVVSQVFLFYRGLDLVANAGAGAIGYPMILSICIVGFSAYSTLILREKLTLRMGIALVLNLTGIIFLAL